MSAPLPSDLLDALRAARRVVVFTGAGVSAESGIPTFRGPRSGLWERYRPEDLATAEAFERNPPLVWGWYEWRRMLVRRARPNPAHLAIARMAERIPGLTVVTQNVDDLHERAGSPDVLHLHGGLERTRCFDCGRPHALPPGIPDEPEGGRLLEPPRCLHCGGPIRPGVVWFGESLPADAWDAAADACAACDLMFSVGTSALVYPAAHLPEQAARRGAPVIDVNVAPAETGGRPAGRFHLRQPAGAAMPAILAAAWPS